jgi:hypothetical protein
LSYAMWVKATLCAVWQHVVPAANEQGLSNHMLDRFPLETRFQI